MEEEILKYYAGFAFSDFEKMVDDIFEQSEKIVNTDVVLEYRNINGNIKYFLNGVECTKDEYDKQSNKIAPIRFKFSSGGPYITPLRAYLLDNLYNNNILC